MSQYSKFDSMIDLMSFLKSVSYKDFTTLMSDRDVYISQTGSCHDQALFEYFALRHLKYNPKIHFIIAVDVNGQGMETHSFVSFETSGSYYWLENAWGPYAGLHKYKNEHDLVSIVTDLFISSGNYSDVTKFYLSIVDPYKHPVGESLEEFVDTCMDNAVEV